MDVICRPDGSLKSLLTKFLGEKQQSELIQGLNIQVDDVVLLTAGEHERVVGIIFFLWGWLCGLDVAVDGLDVI